MKYVLRASSIEKPSKAIVLHEKITIYTIYDTEQDVIYLSDIDGILSHNLEVISLRGQDWNSVVQGVEIDGNELIMTRPIRIIPLSFCDKYTFLYRGTNFDYYVTFGKEQYKNYSALEIINNYEDLQNNRFSRVDLTVSTKRFVSEDNYIYSSVLESIDKDLIDIEYVIGEKIVYLSEIFTECVILPKDKNETTLDLSNFHTHNIIGCFNLVEVNNFKKLKFLKLNLEYLHDFNYPVVFDRNLRILDFSDCYNDILDKKQEKYNFGLFDFCPYMIVVPESAKVFKKYLIKDNDLTDLGKIDRNNIDSFFSKIILLGRKEHYLVSV